MSMLDMTFPEFEAAVAKTDIALIPLSAIEEHGPHLPLSTDSIIVSGQLADVQQHLKESGIETIIGPLLHIGITTEAGDWSNDGTYMYPGSLTVSADTFIALYLDLIRSLRKNGLRRFFLYSGHYGPRHLKVVARIAEQASIKFDHVKAYALIHSESVERFELTSNPYVLPVERGRNFELLSELLGSGSEKPTSTHADGTETSEVLYRQPNSVRVNYKELPESPSSHFFEAYLEGNRLKNPGGMGGFPFDRASAEAGKAIADFRTRSIAATIMKALEINS
ncbi:MAG TPA: creatininase family protein [Blastocatellia bacterium]|nr:creatininase family protein [Blastocatellia bacterium]